MGDFGGTLRSARERKGISLRHIANATKISMGALEALERNDYKRLPGGIFSRSFVRAYAAEVGLDPDQTVAEFLKEAGEAFEPPPQIVEEDTPLLPEREEALDFRQSPRVARMFGLGTWTAIVIVLAIGAVYFAVRMMNRTAPVAAPPPTAAAPSDQQQQPAQPQPEAAAPAGPIPDLAPGEPMRIVLEPTAQCWVSVTVDGEPRIARIMNPGERETYDIREGAQLRVGDAGAMSFTINGRRSKPLGEKGSPETIRITRDNFKEFVQ